MKFQTERLILHVFGDLHIEIRKTGGQKSSGRIKYFNPQQPGAIGS